MIFLVNMDQRSFLKKKSKWLLPIHEWIKAHGGGVMIPFSIEFEEKAHALRESPAELAKFLEETGGKSSLPKIVKQGYQDLKLSYFFTAGDKEVRCWTIREGTLAPQAAGVIHRIHTDFEKLFVKAAAEVVAFEDFKALATTKFDGIANCKAGGKWRQEGKSYGESFRESNFNFRSLINVG